MTGLAVVAAAATLLGVAAVDPTAEDRVVATAPDRPSSTPPVEVLRREGATLTFTSTGTDATLTLGPPSETSPSITIPPEFPVEVSTVGFDPTSGQRTLFGVARDHVARLEVDVFEATVTVLPRRHDAAPGLGFYLLAVAAPEGPTAIRAYAADGTLLSEGGFVTVEGPARVVVPDLVGRTLAEAEATLVALGLRGAVDPRLDSDDPAATVLAQQPGAGEMIAVGSTVGFRTAAPAPPPDVRCPLAPTDGTTDLDAVRRAAGELAQPEATAVHVAHAEGGGYQLLVVLPDAGACPTETPDSEVRLAFVVDG